MDKKQLLSHSLAKIMIDEISDIDNLVRLHPKASSQFKQDNSPVTELDLSLSYHFEFLVNKHFSGVTFYSEEKYSEWQFPLLVLDPLDGTKEYIEGRDDWAISLAYFQNENFSGEGWIYNPKRQECFSDISYRSFENKNVFRGEVSRSEWKSGLFKEQSNEKFIVEPVGSIAYKLGRLSAGKSDFVVSLKPKNIWDIAGGTLLCQKAGLKFYSEGKEVSMVKKFFEPPLIWCHEELFSELSETYFLKDKDL